MRANQGKRAQHDQTPDRRQPCDRSVCQPWTAKRSLRPPRVAVGEEIRKSDAQAEEEWYYSVGTQNYVYTLPLTMLERERKVRLNPVALEKAKKFAPAAPINEIGHMKTLATADDVMPYTPNNDTVYSGAMFELEDGPVILSVPDISDRYWSVEVADAYTNNLFYIGTRATGGKGGNHVSSGQTGRDAADGRDRTPRADQHRDVRRSHRRCAARQRGFAEGQRAPGRVQDDLAQQLGRSEQVRASDNSPACQAPDYQGDLAYFQTVADFLAENPPPKDQEAAAILLSRGGIDIGQPMDPRA